MATKEKTRNVPSLNISAVCLPTTSRHTPNWSSWHGQCALVEAPSFKVQFVSSICYVNLHANMWCIILVILSNMVDMHMSKWSALTGEQHIQISTKLDHKQQSYDFDNKSGKCPIPQYLSCSFPKKVESYNKFKPFIRWMSIVKGINLRSPVWVFLNFPWLFKHFLCPIAEKLSYLFP